MPKEKRPQNPSFSPFFLKNAPPLFILMVKVSKNPFCKKQIFSKPNKSDYFLPFLSFFLLTKRFFCGLIEYIE